MLSKGACQQHTCVNDVVVINTAAHAGQAQIQTHRHAVVEVLAQAECVSYPAGAYLVALLLQQHIATLCLLQLQLKLLLLSNSCCLLLLCRCHCTAPRVQLCSFLVQGLLQL
jgi:hypothetical protein